MVYVYLKQIMIMINPGQLRRIDVIDLNNFGIGNESDEIRHHFDKNSITILLGGLIIYPETVNEKKICLVTVFYIMKPSLFLHSCREQLNYMN